MNNFKRKLQNSVVDEIFALTDQHIHRFKFNVQIEIERKHRNKKIRHLQKIRVS